MDHDRERRDLKDKRKITPDYEGVDGDRGKGGEDPVGHPRGEYRGPKRCQPAS